MSLTDLTLLASLVSSVAVLVSLLFIGLQIRQSNRNQRSLMQQGRSTRNVELLSRLSDPKLSDIWVRLSAGETLADAEYYMLYGYMASVFWSYEDCFFQFHAGMLDAKSWASDVTTLDGCSATLHIERFGGPCGVLLRMNTDPSWMDSRSKPSTTHRPIW